MGDDGSGAKFHLVRVVVVASPNALADAAAAEEEEEEEEVLNSDRLKGCSVKVITYL